MYSTGFLLLQKTEAANIIFFSLVENATKFSQIRSISVFHTSTQILETGGSN